MGLSVRNPVLANVEVRARQLSMLGEVGDALAIDAVALRDRGPDCPDLDRCRRALGYVDMAIAALRQDRPPVTFEPRTGRDPRLPPGRPHP